MYIQVNNQSVYYQKVGQGKNLILLHGWGNDLSSFWPVVNLLKGNFTLWLVDLPGFGRSEPPKHQFTVSDYAQTIEQFIVKNKITQPSLLGHSVGGRIGIKLATRYPDQLDKLVLEASAGIRPRQDPIKLLVYPAAKSFRYLVPNIFGLKERIRYRFYKTLESDYLSAGQMKETLTNLINEDLTKDLKKIRTETLLIWGENDPTDEASLKNGKRMYRLIEKSRLEVFSDTGHFPHLEKPDRFAYFVNDFLR